MKLTKKVGGFTLVEIMIVVSIIGLLAAIAVPNFIRSRKRAQGTQVLEDLRLLDSAADQYALEFNKSGSTTLTFTQVKTYLKTGSRLESSGGKDVFGNSFGTFTVDTLPRIPKSTFADLSSVCPASFWSPFEVAP